MSWKANLRLDSGCSGGKLSLVLRPVSNEVSEDDDVVRYSSFLTDQVYI